MASRICGCCRPKKKRESVIPSVAMIPVSKNGGTNISQGGNTEITDGTVVKGSISDLSQNRSMEKPIVKARRNSSSAPTVLVKELESLLQLHLSGLSNLKKYNQKDLQHLQPRRSNDSRAVAILPLATDQKLREAYLNFLGYVRFGLILEDLDTFAVWLSYRHNQTAERMGQIPIHHPMAIVTACVDRIGLHPRLISADRDIIFDGLISWTGRTSLEATIRLLQERKPATTLGNPDLVEQCDQILEAKFVMVAMDPITKGPVPVHPLVPETAYEKDLFRLGEESKNQRLRQKEQSLLKTPPTSAETALLHELFIQTLDPRIHSFRHRVLPPNHVWTEDCKLKNVVICFPQQRNLYNKIFGGFIMRSAFELAWANAASFSSSHPITLAVHDILFRKPVDIGRLLYLSSEMCFTNGKQMQVRVHAEVVNIEKGTQDTTNTFYFTFSSGDGKEVRRVMPKSYGDGMLYIAGKRHYDELMNVTKK